jgi:hypothetical protein
VSATGETPDNAAEVLADFRSRCDTIEEAYEFFLAYASQGLPADHAGASGDQARDYLRRCDRALGGLAESLTSAVARLSVDASPYQAFIEVIDRDARDAKAAVQLVIAQRFIGSGLVDNLNASIHLRALLTDLFLIDESLKAHAR